MGRDEFLHKEQYLLIGRNSKKLNKNGDKIIKYKAHLMVEGFNYKGIDFGENFSPIVKMYSIKIVLILVANLNLDILQLDVRITFLQDDLEEMIYMIQFLSKKNNIQFVC